MKNLPHKTFLLVLLIVGLFVLAGTIFTYVNTSTNNSCKKEVKADKPFMEQIETNSMLISKNDYYAYEQLEEVNPPESVKQKTLQYLIDWYEAPGNCEANNPETAIYYYAVDLTNNAYSDFIAIPYKACNNFLRGASNNGPILFIMNLQDEWSVQGNFFGNGFYIDDQDTIDPQDVYIHQHGTAYSGYENLYRWEKLGKDYYGYQQVFKKLYQFSSE